MDVDFSSDAEDNRTMGGQDSNIPPLFFKSAPFFKSVARRWLVVPRINTNQLAFANSANHIAHHGRQGLGVPRPWNRC
jgi:hypothetical protein